MVHTNVHTHTHSHTCIRKSKLFVSLPLECKNRFVKVEYNPSTATISCTFENQSDPSPKSCSVKYGPCDKEMYFAQNNTTDRSPSIVILMLNSSAINQAECYVITARNDTFTVMVKGNFDTQSNRNLGVIVGSVIGAILGLIVVAVIVTVIACVIAVKRKKRGMFNQEHMKGRSVQLALYTIIISKNKVMLADSHSG